MVTATVVAVVGGTATVLLGASTVQATRRQRARRAAGRRMGLTNPADRPVPPVVADLLTRAGIDDGHRRRFDRWRVVVALTVVAIPLAPGGVVLAALAIVGPPVHLVARRGAVRAARTAALPLGLDAIASSLRGGLSLTNAIGAAARQNGPLATDFARIHDQAQSGRPLAAAIDEWSGVGVPTRDPVPSPTEAQAGAPTGDEAGRRLAGAALALSARVGGAGALAVDAAASSLRERAEADAEVDALSVQARLSAGLLTVTPIGFMLLLTTLDPASARFLFATPTGWCCIVVGAGLDAAGAMWMRRIVGAAR